MFSGSSYWCVCGVSTPTPCPRAAAALLHKTQRQAQTSVPLMATEGVCVRPPTHTHTLRQPLILAPRDFDGETKTSQVPLGARTPGGPPSTAPMLLPPLGNVLHPPTPPAISVVIPEIVPPRAPSPRRAHASIRSALKGIPRLSVSVDKKKAPYALSG